MAEEPDGVGRNQGHQQASETTGDSHRRAVLWILPLIPQPYRMMVLLAQCSGLRVEEVLAVEKPDIHFEKLSMQIVRAVVDGRVKLVKTEYSEDELPLDSGLGRHLARLPSRSRV